MAYNGDNEKPSGRAKHPTPAIGSPPLRDPAIGRTIAGNFRVIKLIGAGAMGNVYQAEQVSLGKMVALKLLHRELMADEKLIKRFELEAKNASSLNHPNSIQIIDFGREADILYIAMELLPGRDLSKVIEAEAPLPLPRVAHIMDQVLQALEEAHEQRIVHRDLKPANIMMVPRRGDPDFVKVCDFGIAKAQSAPNSGGEMLTMKGLICGTPEYMSPEQARGEEVDGRADLYAAAVILYQLVCGELPFIDSSPVALLSKHLVELPLAPSSRRPDRGIPAALESLILRGMEKNPADRPQTALAFREELRSIFPAATATPPGNLTGISGSQLATPVSSERMMRAANTMVSPTTGFRRRRRRVVSGLVTATVVVVGACILLLRPEQSPPPPAEPTPATAATATPAPAVAIPAAVEPATPVEQPRIEPMVAPPAPVAAAPLAARDSGKHVRHNTATRSAHATARSEGPARPIAAGNAVTESPPPSAEPAAAPSPVPSTPAAPSMRDVMLEAERLLGQGEVGAACAKGEDARRLSPKLATNYRFLGKCYMRAGAHERANENYRKYLELAPDASDAAFIQSIVK